MLFTMKFHERACTFMDFHGQFRLGKFPTSEYPAFEYYFIWTFTLNKNH